MTTHFQQSPPFSLMEILSYLDAPLVLANIIPLYFMQISIFLCTPPLTSMEERYYPLLALYDLFSIL